LGRPWERWSDFVFAFHESDEIGPKMLASIAKVYRATDSQFKRVSGDQGAP
jgi:hypothetical protein